MLLLMTKFASRVTEKWKRNTQEKVPAEYYVSIFL